MQRAVLPVMSAMLSGLGVDMEIDTGMNMGMGMDMGMGGGQGAPLSFRDKCVWATILCSEEDETDLFFLSSTTTSSSSSSGSSSSYDRLRTIKAGHVFKRSGVRYIAPPGPSTASVSGSAGAIPLAAPVGSCASFLQPPQPQPRRLEVYVYDYCHARDLAGLVVHGSPLEALVRGKHMHRTHTHRLSLHSHESAIAVGQELELELELELAQELEPELAVGATVYAPSALRQLQQLRGECGGSPSVSLAADAVAASAASLAGRARVGQLPCASAATPLSPPPPATFPASGISEALHPLLHAYRRQAPSPSLLPSHAPSAASVAARRLWQAIVSFDRYSAHTGTRVLVCAALCALVGGSIARLGAMVARIARTAVSPLTLASRAGARATMHTLHARRTVDGRRVSGRSVASSAWLRFTLLFRFSYIAGLFGLLAGLQRNYPTTKCLAPISL